MSENEFDRIAWKRGMKMRINETGEIWEVFQVNFEYRTVMLANQRNYKDWFLFYQIQILD
jgi:hypothetical protein